MHLPVYNKASSFLQTPKKLLQLKYIRASNNDPAKQHGEEAVIGTTRIFVSRIFLVGHEQETGNHLNAAVAIYSDFETRQTQLPKAFTLHRA